MERAAGRAQLDSGALDLACHFAEWATRAAPEAEAAQSLKRDVYASRLTAADSLMEQGIYRATMNDARIALGQEPEVSERGLSFGGSAPD